MTSRRDEAEWCVLGHQGARNNLDMVHRILGKLKWTGKLQDCDIIIRHRGALHDQKIISGADVTEVTKGHFSCQQNDTGITIPFHRILEIRCQGKTVWKRHGQQ